jgi:hypothetical protein
MAYLARLSITLLYDNEWMDDRRMMTWKESVRGVIEVISQHFAGGTEENLGNFGQHSRCPGRVAK